MTKLERSSLTDQATQAIIDLIQERNLHGGDSLPSTAELAATFEVSVPVIREAIAGLVTIGLLKRQQGREAIVSTPEASHFARLLGLRVAAAQVDDEAIQQFREIVEVGNARLAARNRTDSNLHEIDEALTVLRHADTPERLHSADVAFHATLARAAGNDLFVLTLAALEPLLHRTRQHAWNGWATAGGDLKSIVEAHALIRDAIRDQDEAGAARAMTTHLHQTRRGLEAPKGSNDHRPFTPQRS